VYFCLFIKYTHDYPQELKGSKANVNLRRGGDGWEETISCTFIDAKRMKGRRRERETKEKDKRRTRKNSVPI
jgi:hypothetical protein